MTRTWLRPRGVEEHPIPADAERLSAERSEVACLALRAATALMACGLAGVLLWVAAHA